MTDQDRIAQLEDELAEAQAKNARLVAALHRLDDAWGNDDDIPHHLWQAIHKLNTTHDFTALRDLLGPIESELRGWIHTDCQVKFPCFECKRLQPIVARLRALVERKP